jgi:biotin carboxyl carrier protein
MRKKKEDTIVIKTKNDSKDGKPKESQTEKSGLKEGEAIFVIDNTEYRTTLSYKYLNRKPYKPRDPKKLLAFMPGNIEAIFVKKNDPVKIGDKLLVLEAMKMKNEIISPIDGKIKQVFVNKDDKVTKNQLLIELQ